MTSEPLTRHSHNLTVVILILFYYVVCVYAALLGRVSPLMPNSWEVGLIYWLLLGSALRNWRFLATQMFSMIAFGVVLTVLQTVRFALDYGMVRATTATYTLPVVIFLFVVCPGIFFSFNFDPYGLVRELPRIINRRATAHLLLMLSTGEMFRARLAEVSENLLVRGIDITSPGRRLLNIPTFLPPLMMALIQEAAYRHSYIRMLGCPEDRFPHQRTRTTISAAQKVALFLALLLLAARVAI